IFFSFLVAFGVIVFAVYYIDNYRHPLGFSYQNVWSVQVDIQRQSDEGDKQQLLDTTKQMLTTLKDFGEVESAAAVVMSPYSRGNWSSGQTINGRPINYWINFMTDDAKDVFDIKVVRGRWFGKEDDGADYKPVILNQKTARDFFGDEDPLGKNIIDKLEEKARVNKEGKKRKEERVIGIIEDFRKNGEFAELYGYAIYRNDLKLPDGQPPRFFVIKVRSGTTAEFEEKLIKRMQSLAKDWSFDVKTIEQMRTENHTSYYVPIAAFGLVAGFLMLMVALGLTGVLWQSVTQRTKEIGLRRAKGATAKRIYNQILGELLVITTFGLIIGTLVVIQFPLLDFLGFATKQVYFYSLLISLALIYVLTIVCGLYPSRLATKVQPAEALHYE
ncbi:MAG TPA: FtsX-like permease family protein, partial [Blastocatellia bacterium]|nr:FtsX-like permease family protein [Blastocatellia bacterium]